MCKNLSGESLEVEYLWDMSTKKQLEREIVE